MGWNDDQDDMGRDWLIGCPLMFFVTGSVLL